MPTASSCALGENSHPRTLVELLRGRALGRPEGSAYTFLPDGETAEDNLTYGELDRRARAVGGRLRRAGATGARVLLLCPWGADYVAAFFGCLYAGAVAVPAYPPRRNRSLARLQGIAADSQAAFALTTPAADSALAPLLDEDPGLRSLRRLTVGRGEAPADDWREPDLAGESLAFLQYSSGSTSEPKGVMVSHANLLHNQRVIQHAFGQTADSVIVGWLPLHHDMGLIGNVVQPLYLGARCVLMSPLSFLQRPARWLEAVSRYRATTSGGPDFAYELCARKLTEGQRAALDLSSWGVAFNGAEPVRAATLDAFAEAFAPSGFRREAFQPCYGLAEATLMVTGGRRDLPPTVRSLSAEALARNVVSEAADEPGPTRRLVGCGRPLLDQKTVIVDPESLRACAPDEVGEIWVSGPSVAQGYWNRPEETEQTFRAAVAGAGGESFLRTGDLGFMRDGELFVAGRLKDVIILLGRNLHPQDIELTAERSHKLLRPHSGAAFSVERSGAERLVVLQEAAARRPSPSLEEAVAAIREAVAAEHEVRPDAVVLLRPGTLPKTTSGKIRRHACRAMFLEGTLDALAEWRADDSEPTDEHADGTEDVADWLTSLLAARLNTDARRVAADRPVVDYGLDSLAAVELAHAVERRFGASVSVARLLQDASINDIAKQVRAALDARTPPAATPDAPATPRPSRSPLSEGQKALWLSHQLAPQSAAYNIASALRVTSALDTAALRRAFRSLVERHESLRTTFGAEDGEPFQHVAEGGELHFREHDASAWGERRLKEALDAEAQRPFDLEAGPVLRVYVFKRAAREHVLLLVAHHIVADLWSLAVMLRELGTLYEAEAKGEAAALAPLPLSYTDYARRQREMLSGERGERLWRYWQTRLGGELPVLNLPTDRPRPPVQTFVGGSHTFRVGPELTRRLREVGRACGATLYATLLAAFEVLLYRYTGQQDLTVGSPTAGRASASLSGLVGYFVNPVVLRERLSGGTTFEAFLRQVRRTALEAFEHQEYPFALLVERLQPARDPARPPLFQTFFALQQAPPAGAEQLAAFALGEAGAPLSLAGLELEAVALEQRTAQFDLSLVLAESGGGLTGSWQYNSDLFDAETVARTAGHFLALLADVCAAPRKRLSELSLLGADEARRLLCEPNDTRRPRPACASVVELFEAQAARTPEAVAATFRHEHLTYGELNARANRLARHLTSLGVVPEAKVGLLLGHSLELVAAVLAVLKAGAAYVPLDAQSPAERLRFMLEDAGVALVLTEAKTRARLPAEFEPLELRIDSEAEALARQSPENTLARLAPQNAAYVIYTSGSTGRPKGVCVQHSSLVNYVNWAAEAYARGAPADFPLYSSLAFDLTVTSLYVPLAVGGRVVVYDAGARLSPLEELLEDDRVDVVKLTPAHLALLKGRDNRGSRVRLLVVGGEALEAALAREAAESFGGAVEVVNEYGPTEATVGCTAYSFDPARDARAFVPAGRPVANTRVYVLDEDLAPVVTGVAGQLYVAGDGLARGYHANPAATAERFIPDPFATEPGARLYATGDTARWLPEGQLEFVGRRDGQVKVRGFRVELGEVEAALASHPRVGASVVLADGDGAGGVRHLTAYVVCDGDVPTAGELRAHLRARLPEYMMPSEFVPLERLPLTPNGKVDRRRLPSPRRPRPGWLGEYVAPRTPVEEVLAGVFAQVLDTDAAPGVHDDFFDLGGHSLKGMTVVARVREAFGVELPLRALFESPTVAKLAVRVAGESGGGAGPAAPPLRAAERAGPAPLSFAQQRLWFLDQLEGPAAVYNVPGAVRLVGALDADALRRSVAEVVRRHETLRTTFAAHGGEPVQLVTPAVDLPLHTVDLSTLVPEAREAEARRLAREEARRPFDLARGPLLRAGLLRLAEREHVLLLTMHHIVSDEWSLGVFVDELAALYEAFRGGRPSPLAGLPVQYADYAVWQREWLRGEALEAQLAYWRRQLEGVPQALELPADRPRPPVQRPRGARHHLRLAPELGEALKLLSRREGATLFMTLLAAFDVLLARYTGREGFLVGTPVANRNSAETESLVGFFVNTLVLRADLSGDPTFKELLARVRETALGAYAHRELPFEKLVEELQPERDLGRNPLFQVLFQLEHGRAEALRLPGLTASPFEVDSGTAKFDLELDLTSAPDRLGGFFEYNTDLFDAETIARLGRHFENLLAAVVAAPERRLSELPLLDADEERQLVRGWNQTRREFPLGLCFPQLFEAQVRRTPDAAAVTCGDERLSYDELNRRANRLARQLVAGGVGPDAVVGLLAERGLDFLTAVLAVFKAGGAYLPLDPRHPARRTAQVLEQSRCAVVLVADALEPSLREALARVAAPPALLSLERALARRRERDDDLPARARPRDLAYVIYTSGSTGAPKGSMIEHVGMVNHLFAKLSDLRMGDADVVAQNASQCFDISVWQFLSPLLVGGRVHVVADESAHDPARLLEETAGRRVTVLEVVPSLLGAMLGGGGDAGPDLSSLRWLVVTGEAFAPDLCRRWLRLHPSVPAVNAYGPTECSDDVTHCVIADAPPDDLATIPIGRPIANMMLYVLDRRLRPVPLGAHGELYVSGRGVGRGYLRDPSRTAEAFLPDPFSDEPGARMYRTGDLVRRLPDGRLEFLGRIDQQVKVRGFRIELGEIEAALRQHAGVSEAVVVALDDGAARGRRLVAYVVPCGDSEEPAADWREFLRERLPDYMVPSALVRLGRLPLTTSGKLDRRALPPPDESAPSADGHAPPRNAVEQALADIWADVLQVERVGVHDNFFELGGHSLLATQLVSRVREALRADLSLRLIFERPTVAEMAQSLEASAAAPPPGEHRRIQARPRGRKNFQQLMSKIEQLSDAASPRAGVGGGEAVGDE